MTRIGGILGALVLAVIAAVKLLAHEVPPIVQDVTQVVRHLNSAEVHTIAADAAEVLQIEAVRVEPWMNHVLANPSVSHASFASATKTAESEAHKLDSLAEGLAAIAEENGLTRDHLADEVVDIVRGSMCDAMSEAMAGEDVKPLDILKKNGLLKLFGEPVESLALASDTGKQIATNLKRGKSAGQTLNAARLSVECALAGRKP